MTTKISHTTESEILDVIRQVKDPEIPALSIVDLGMITGITVRRDNRITVSMTPTYTGCPALEVIRTNIVNALNEAGYKNAEVITDKSVSWSTNRISEKGKKQLVDFGLGAPQAHAGDVSEELLNEATCPHCGSTNTTMSSIFGSALCRSIHFCYSCRETFERIKPH